MELLSDAWRVWGRICGHSRLPGGLREALRDGAEVELLSIHPAPNEKRGLAEPLGEELHSHEIFGALVLERAEVLKFIEELEMGLQGFEPLILKKCAFEPRHALRVRHLGRLHEVLICYQCADVMLYQDGRALRFAQLRSRPSPERANQLLAAQGIPVVPEIWWR